MLKPKPARAPNSAKRSRHFSLVSNEAQQQMYRALCALQARWGANGNATGHPGAAAVGVLEWTGAEVAEIAACLAAGRSCVRLLACSGMGVRIASTQADLGMMEDAFVEVSEAISGNGRRLTSATLAAMNTLLTRSLDGSPDQELTSVPASAGAPAKASRTRNARKKHGTHPREEAAIVCAGLIERGAEAERDYRAAFSFAARHKLPIVYVIANRPAPGQSAPLDLRSIYPEFGIPLFTVDANDAIASYRVATEALHHARHLRGPSVIEALLMTAQGAVAHSPLELLTAYMERHGNPPQ